MSGGIWEFTIGLFFADAGSNMNSTKSGGINAKCPIVIGQII
jgi:hypothetical protein